MASRAYQEEYAEKQPRGGMSRLIIGMLLIAAGVIFMYTSIAVPQEGTFMTTVKAVIAGLGGHLRFVLPLVFVWAGIICALACFRRRPPAWRIFLDACQILVLFTAVQLFFVDEVRAAGSSMRIQGWLDFVSKSYVIKQGGGAVGALLAWPLFRFVGGTWGGLIACFVFTIIANTINGRIGRLVNWFNSQSDAREERRISNENEHMFESNDDSLLDNAFDAPRRRPRQPRREPQQTQSAPVQGFEPMPAARTREEAPRKERPAPIPQRPATKSREEILAEDPVDKPRITAADVKPRKSKKVRPAQDEPMPAVSSKPSAGKKLPDWDVPLEAQEEAPAPKKGKKQMPEPAAEEDDFAPWEDKTKSSLNPIQMGITRDLDKPLSETAKPKRGKKKEEPVEEIDLFEIEPDAYETDDEPFQPDPQPLRRPEPGKLRRATAEEMETEQEEEPYNYPPIDLLRAPDAKAAQNNRQADMEKAKLLEETLRSFGIETRLTGIAHGPVVTRFELQPAPGVKVSRITSLADDIALNLAAESVRIEAPIPGKAAVGVEIPNEERETVSLREVLESAEARRHPSRIAVGLGKDNSGRYIVADIAKMPHVLIAGQTGSGKSVCINALIVSILYRSTPDEVKMILIDPKVVELSVYNGMPHLISPVVTDPKKAASALNWAVAQMSDRYKKFAERGVRDIKGYNKKLQPGEKPMPQMVIVIDELADLMMVAPGEVEDSICRLAQLARAAGMHLVIATQRPSVNVITGIIKANIPTRIAFSVASQIDSRTMIDHGGAEKLLGRGDMLFVPSGMKPIRVQGVWVADEEVEAVVEFIKERSEPTYDQDMVEQINNSVLSDAEKEEVSNEYDPRLPEAVEIVLEAGQASISMLQRRMRIGYARAGRLIDEMSLRGLVSEADGAKPRQVLITREEFERMFEEEE